MFVSELVGKRQNLQRKAYWLYNIYACSLSVETFPYMQAYLVTLPQIRVLLCKKKSVLIMQGVSIVSLRNKDVLYEFTSLVTSLKLIRDFPSFICCISKRFSSQNITPSFIFSKRYKSGCDLLI